MDVFNRNNQKILEEVGCELKDISKTPGFRAAGGSCFVWCVQNDAIESDLAPNSGYNLAPNEFSITSLANVTLKALMTSSQRVGSYQGVSVRVASGIWAHVGGSRGHAEETTDLKDLDYGELLITTRACYFSGKEKGTNFKIPFNKILRISPYSDAVGIAKDGGKEQLFVFHPVTSPDCAWWVYNLLQSLMHQSASPATRWNGKYVKVELFPKQDDYTLPGVEYGAAFNVAGRRRRSLRWRPS
jgi:hypothetical protein